MNWLMPIRNTLSGIWKVVSSIFSDTKETIASIVMMVVYKGTIEGTAITTINWLNNMITIGMFIIIWYGVLKILINTL